MFYFFFFQAEDGIRDLTVTGVQTCALPISRGDPCARHDPPTAHEALELSEVRRAVPEGGPLLLPQERRAAESVSPVQAGVARGDPRDAARSEHPLRRRDGGAPDAGGRRQRAVACAWHGREPVRTGSA